VGGEGSDGPEGLVERSVNVDYGKLKVGFRKMV